MEWKLEAQNKYRTLTIKEKTKSQNEKIIQKTDKERTTVGHIPDALTKILFPLMKTWKIYSMKATISENHCDAPEGKLCNYQLFDQKAIEKLLWKKKQKR